MCLESEAGHTRTRTQRTDVPSECAPVKGALHLDFLCVLGICSTFLGVKKRFVSYWNHGVYWDLIKICDKVLQKEG